MRNIKTEVLAPAGSFEIMQAVIRAGADAVYLGGDMFGARAFAGNLNKEQLIEAIEYAHIFGRKIYLTVNTLLKQQEIDKYLIEYIKPFYEAGLDAVIVQDMGVFKLIKEHFPDMDIHASTQMTQTGSSGSALLKSLGATRVVTSREMTLEEIRSLHENVDVEIESFVHGALCYCYSGQCLMSSFNGGRSGNRGRCAQPCRLAYDVYDKGTKVSSEKEKYVLSPKDMCALDILPDVLDAGVFSLKIEGRMKNVTYAAFVTSMYRKYVDMYLKKGRAGYKVDPQDAMRLMDIYNRGAFTTGYYDSEKGRNMMSLSRPNHMGVEALRVLDNASGRITFKTLVDINAGDVFEIDRKHSFESGSNVSKGGSFVVNLPKKYPLYKGRIVNRMNNNQLRLLVNDSYVEKELKLPVKFSLKAKENEPLTLTVEYGDLTFESVCEIVTRAEKQPATVDNLVKNLSKTGDTYFFVEKSEVELDDNVFVPVGWIKEIRRDVLGKLERALRESNKRTYIERNFQLRDSVGKTETLNKCVYLYKLNNLDFLLTREDVKEIYLDYSLYKLLGDGFEKAIKKISNGGKAVYIALPHILEESKKNVFKRLVSDISRFEIDGFLCKNIEEIGYISELGFAGKVITDSGIYICNSYAKDYIENLVNTSGNELVRMTLPLELTNKELDAVASTRTEMVMYGKAPLMVSKQCVRKTMGLCDGKNNAVVISGAKNGEYTVKSYCEFCYTVMKKDNINLTQTEGFDLGCEAYRYEFEDETLYEMKSILDGTYDKGNFGHFYSSID